MTKYQIHTNEINCETGASNWLTALPLQDKEFHLSKESFGMRFYFDISGQFLDFHQNVHMVKNLIYLTLDLARKVALSHNVTMNYVTLEQTCCRNFAHRSVLSRHSTNSLVFDGASRIFGYKGFRPTRSSLPRTKSRTDFRHQRKRKEAYV